MGKSRSSSRQTSTTQTTYAPEYTTEIDNSVSVTDSPTAQLAIQEAARTARASVDATARAAGASVAAQRDTARAGFVANERVSLGAIDEIGDFGVSALDANEQGVRYALSFGDSVAGYQSRALRDALDFGEAINRDSLDSVDYAVETSEDAIITAAAGFRNYAGNLASVAGGGTGIGASQGDEIENLTNAAAIIGGIAAAFYFLK